MTDRDRLAADLRTVRHAGGPCGHAGLTCVEWADRLIALGWTNWFRADSELTTAYMVGFEKGKDAARADLAARLIARIEAWPVVRRHMWDYNEVLAAIREEAEGE